MQRVLECGAIFLGCGHVIRAASDEDVLRLAAEHARQVHGVREIDDETARKVKAAITTK